MNGPASKALVPKLRFPGFSGEWQAKRLREVSQKGQYGIGAAAKEYDGINKYLRITDISDETRKLISEGLTSPSGKLDDKYLLKPNDLVFARTGASTGKTYLYDVCDGRLYFAGFLIRFNINSANSYFVYSQTIRRAYDIWVAAISARSGQPGINAEEFGEYKFFAPELLEQRKIAEFLTAVDDRIGLSERKLELLKKYKQGVMQKIFTQQIRFKDSNGKQYPKWEEKELGEIAVAISARNRDESIKLVLTNSAVAGVVNQAEYFDKDIANQGNLANYHVVSVDDFVYNPRISQSAPVGPIKRNHLSLGVMSPLYSVFRFKEGNLDFFEGYFSTAYWHEYIKSVANSGARHDRMNITTSDLYSMPIPFPSAEEQQKIARFLTALDDKIKLEESKLEQARNFKKSLLQQMFI